MDMYGYAFALFAWFRGEARPAWQKHLRGDVHAAFKKGLRYLTATGDSLFKPLLKKHVGDLWLKSSSRVTEPGQSS